MNIVQNPKIGLCIAGTKSRQGGFVPLMIAGILAGNEDNNMDRVTLVAEKPVYIIKHTNEYILYLLIDRKVKPCDRDTPGVLSIALTIARDIQLANDESPYSLLKEVYDKFRNDYMTPCSDGRDSFINKDVEQADFMTIMNQYPLEKRLSVYIPMNPSGISGTLRVSQEQITDLFRDSQYKEFAEYKEIEIGTGPNCPMMPNLENIEIPRPVTYSITVNGRTVKATLTKPADSFDTASVLSDTQDVRYNHVAFRLEELLNSPEHQIESGESSVMLDMEHRRIVCNVYKEQITYTLEYRIEGGTDTERKDIVNGIISGEIKLGIGNHLVKFYSSSPKEAIIPASCVHQKAIITPHYKGTLRLELGVHDVDKENRRVLVTIQITVKSVGSLNDNDRYSGSNYSMKPVDGEKVKDDYKELIDRTSGHGDKHSFGKTKQNWIFFIIGLIIGMCLGFGSWGGYSYKIKKTQQDSIKAVQEKAQQDSINAVQEKARQDSIKAAQEKTRQDSIKAAQEKVRQDSIKAAQEKARQDSIKAAQEKVRLQKKEMQQQARKNILLYINGKLSIEECRKCNDWEYLSQEDKLAVEAVLNLSQYKGTKKKIVENILVKKTTYSSWENLIETRKEIIKALSDN